MTLREIQMPAFELDGGELLRGPATADNDEWLRLWWCSPQGRAEVRVSLRMLARLGAMALRNRTGRATSDGHLARRV